MPDEEAWSRISGDASLARWFARGERFDDRPRGQVAAVVNDPADALFRVSIEPGAPGTELREIVLWLSAWGDHARRIAEIQAQWSALLDRLYPEGTTP
jgi:hypothetical protein